MGMIVGMKVGRRASTVGAMLMRVLIESWE